MLVDILKFVKLKKYRNRNIDVIYVKRFFHSNLNLKDTEQPIPDQTLSVSIVPKVLREKAII